MPQVNHKVDLASIFATLEAAGIDTRRLRRQGAGSIPDAIRSVSKSIGDGLAAADELSAQLERGRALLGRRR